MERSGRSVVPEPSVDRVQDRRDELAARYGRWTASNIRLAQGVFTQGSDRVRPAEQRVHRVVQAVADLAGRPLRELRVLDLGCYEGAFALELAMHGATVLGVEARGEHVVKARFAAEALGISSAEFRVGDAREVSVERDGRFDVVLCLGLLYHLEGPQACALVDEIARMTTRLAIIEGQVSLADKMSVTHQDRIYHGRGYPEDVAQPGASVVNREAFWFTRASLLNLLADAGFTSAYELLIPGVPSIMSIRDHVAYAAVKGAALEPRSLPPSATAYSQRVPEKLQPFAHPMQGWRYRLEERWRRRKGGGAPSMFR
jgi:SAM-dependent methyltransferase